MFDLRLISFSNVIFDPQTSIWSVELVALKYGQSRFNITTRNSTIDQSIQGERLVTKSGYLNIHWLFSPQISTLGAIQQIRSLEMKSSYPWIALSKGNQTNLIYSIDEFKSVSKIDLVQKSELLRNRIDTCSGSVISSLEIKDMLVQEQTVYLLTNTGVFMGNETTPSVGWSFISSACVDLIKGNKQPTYDPKWTPLVMIGTGIAEGQMWVFNRAFGVDMTSASIKDALFPSSNTVRYLDCVTSSVQIGDVLCLVHVDSSNYFLVQYTVSTKLWRNLFGFPAQVPTSINTITPLTNTLIANASVPTNATNLVLNKLYESVLGSSDIFITGTGLFYSPLFGYDVAMINSNPANLVTSFAVHENEMFAFSTSVKDLWIGSIDIRSSQQVIPPRSNSNLYIPFFDTHGDVFELVYDGNLNRQYQNRSTALGVTECTYSTIYFEYVAPYQSFISLSNSSIREKQESIKIKTKSLPDTLYLDFYEEFTFEMHLVPQDWSVSSLASVTFEIENSNIVTVQSVRIEDFARRTIVYRVSIIDNGMQRPEQSGLIASLRIIVSRDNLGCLATEEIAKKSTTIYSGCHPSTAVELVRSSAKYPCPYGDSEIPCVWYDSGFNPRFYMVDDMFETQLDLENNYLLQVIGGGVDPKQLERWSRETIQKHNPNGERLTRDAIYYPKHQNRYTVPFYGPSTSGIRWHCKGNVPCADIQPGPNGSPPMYYFLVNVTVIQSDVQVSYCRLSTTFPIGVVGIPLAFQHRITTISTTFSACIVAFCVYLWFRRDEYHLQSRFFQRRVVPIQKGVRFEEANDLWSEEKRNRKIYPEDDIEDVGQEDYIEGDGSDGSDGSEASEGSEEQDYESNSDEEALEALEDQDLDQDFEHDESEHEFSINGFKFKGSINSLNRLASDE